MPGWWSHWRLTVTAEVPVEQRLINARVGSCHCRALTHARWVTHGGLRCLCASWLTCSGMVEVVGGDWMCCTQCVHLGVSTPHLCFLCKPFFQRTHWLCWRPGAVWKCSARHGVTEPRAKKTPTLPSYQGIRRLLQVALDERKQCVAWFVRSKTLSLHDSNSLWMRKDTDASQSTVYHK